MAGKNFYITTPIYYANDRPHIGHAYTTLLADVLSRYHRLLGYEVFFLTGTDEHGQKVQQAAALRGVTPKQQVDEYHLRFKELWARLNIRYDHFIRTTDDYHIRYVQQSLQELHDRGEIYEKDFEGWYSVSEEQFFAEEELIEGKDPIGGKPVEWVGERNYFFRMSNFREALIRHIEEHPDFILPDFRKNEVLGFLKKPLQDLCISRPRSRLEWGIPLPFDPDYVTYVWFDALLNYESGVLDFAFPDGSRAWPADYHLIGKDILTTHCVYWPTMLMGMGRQLPRHILAHGWWLSQGRKQSKSAGNAVDPLELIEDHGVDAVRYYLMRDMVLGQDASVTDELFRTRINTDLANDLGNAVNRVHKFVLSRFDGTMPAISTPGPAEDELRELTGEVRERTVELIKEIKLSFALEEVGRLVRGVNRYLENQAPWKIKGEDEKTLRDLGNILTTAGEALRIALSLLYPVMPEKSRQGLAMLGQPDEPTLDSLDWGRLRGGEKVRRAEALFPRIEARRPTERSEKNGEDSGSGRGKAGSEQKKTANAVAADPGALLDLRIAEIVAVEDHPAADSLYVLRLRSGEEERQVCAGLKGSYRATELLNRRVVLFANLKPAKLRGLESRGMILAADLPDGKARLLDPGELASGSVLRFGELTPSPRTKAGLKDFEKLELRVERGKILYGSRELNGDGDFVRCDAPDGAAVH